MSATREGHPDKLRRRLAGDLDNIVLKALRKEPSRRYGSVEQFSEDIRRHLEGRPVLARKGTASYRAGKFIKRHKAGVAAAALILLTTFGGIVATMWQARAASLQRAKAEQRFNDVRRLANSFMFELHDEIEQLQGSTKARQYLVQRALEYLDSLAREAGDDASLRDEFATAYEKVADVQGNPYSANLGDNPGAMQSYHKAAAIREALFADPNNLQARRNLARLYGKIGDLLGATGQTTEALETHRRVLSLLERAKVEADDSAFRRELALSHTKVADSLLGVGDTGGALDHYRKSLEIREAILAADPANNRLKNDLAVNLSKLATTLTAEGDFGTALEAHRKALAIRLELSAADPANAPNQRGLALTRERTGDVLDLTGKAEAALESQSQALAIRERLAAADPNNVLARKDLAWSHLKVAAMLGKLGRLANAFDHQRKAFSVFEGLAALSPTNAQAQGDLSFAYEGWGMLLYLRRDLAGALANHRKALAIRESLLAADPSDATARDVIASSYLQIGDILLEGNPAEAIAHYRRALATAEPLAGSVPANARYQKHIADSCLGLASAYRRLARSSEACEWYRRSLQTYEQLRSRGRLVHADVQKPDEIASALARCSRTPEIR